MNRKGKGKHRIAPRRLKSSTKESKKGEFRELPKRAKKAAFVKMTKAGTLWKRPKGSRRRSAWAR